MQITFPRSSLSAWSKTLLVSGVLAFSSCLLAAESAGQLFLVVGEVTVTGVDGKNRPGVKGMELFEGDRVRTADNGLAQISLSDGGRLSLRSGSEIKLTEYKFNKDAKEPGAVAFVLSLVRGGFRSITGAIAKTNPDSYKIQTSSATIGVRGTDHEPFFIPEPKLGEAPIAPPGTYDKVNSGQTVIQTKLGIIDIKPGQAGHAPFKIDTPPQVLPKIPEFYGEPPIKGGRMLPLSERKQVDTDKVADTDKGGDKGNDRSEGKGELKSRLATTTLRVVDGDALKEAASEKTAAGEGGATLKGALIKESVGTKLAVEPTATVATPVSTAVTPTATAVTPTATITPTLVSPTVINTTITPTTTVTPTTTISPTTTPILKSTTTTISPTLIVK